MPDLGGTLNAIASKPVLTSIGQSQSIASGGGTFNFATALPDDNQRLIWIHNAGSDVVSVAMDVVGGYALNFIVPAGQQMMIALRQSVLDSAGDFIVTNNGASATVVTVNTMS